MTPNLPITLTVKADEQFRHLMRGLTYQRFCIISALDLTIGSYKPEGPVAQEQRHAIATLWGELRQVEILLAELGNDAPCPEQVALERRAPRLASLVGRDCVPVACVCGFGRSDLVMTTMRAATDGWARIASDHVVFTCDDERGLLSECPACGHEMDQRFVIEVER